MKKLVITAIILGLTCATSTKVYSAVETLKEEPYFKVRYDIPKMPSSVASKEAAQKHLEIYNNYVQRNKLRMQAEERAAQAKLKREQERKILVAQLLKEDRREHLRFNTTKCSKPVVISTNNIKLTNVVDISRGGLGLKSSALKVNDEIPVKISYAGEEVDVKLRIVSDNNGRVGGKFVNIDAQSEDKLIYMSSVMELDNSLLPTKLSR